MTPLQALKSLGTGSEPPAAVKQRVRERIAGSLAIASALGAGAGAAAATVAPARRVAELGFLASRGKLAAAALGLWLSGAATGVVAYRAWQGDAEKAPASAHVVPVSVAPSALAAIEPAPVGLAPPGVEALPVVAERAPRTPASPSARSAASPPATPAASALSGLGRERQLLDRAREALAHGDGSAALAEAAGHERAFPQGALREERLALQVRALFALGRRDEARERARAFVTEFPNSFLTPALESALAEP